MNTIKTKKIMKNVSAWSYASKPSILTKQAGLTLIEVLVSMGLGIFFLGVAVQYLVVGQQSNQSHDASSRIQENARFAIGVIRDEVRMAGYNGDPTIITAPSFIYRNDCGGFNPCSDNELPGNVGDSLAVSYVTPDGQDCLGNDVGVGTEIANVFWIQDVGGVRSLYCRAWDINASGGAGDWTSAAQPLVDGVEYMQVQYGLSPSPNSPAARSAPVDRFLSADGVQDVADDAGQFPPPLNAWDFIRSVRISLLVESGLQTEDSERSGDVSFQAENQTFTMLDGADYSAPDSRPRRVYTTTIEINNSFLN